LQNDPHGIPSQQFHSGVVKKVKKCFCVECYFNTTNVPSLLFSD
jgi:hypothetical protein